MHINLCFKLPAIIRKRKSHLPAVKYTEAAADVPAEIDPLTTAAPYNTALPEISRADEAATWMLFLTATTAPSGEVR